MKIKLRSLVVIILTIALTGCQKSTPATGDKAVHKNISIVTTLFPLYDFARTICRDRASVQLLLPPGVEAHNFEPKPADMISISKADIFIYTNAAMEPWASKLIKGVASQSLKTVDASNRLQLRGGGAEVTGDQHDHADKNAADPHLWLDFNNAAIMVDTIGAAIMERDPGNREFYQKNIDALKVDLKKLDGEFSAGLAACKNKTFLHGGHFTFGYLARRYGLSYHSAQAINPDSEPTPAKLSELLKLVREHQLSYVYSEELLSPRIAEMIVREAGVKILLLHGAHNISRDDLAKGETFIGLMHKNLESLRVGLDCK